MKVTVKKEFDIALDTLIYLIQADIRKFLGDYDEELVNEETIDEVKLAVIKQMTTELAEKREKPSSVSVEEPKEEPTRFLTKDIIFLLENCRNSGADDICAECPLADECYHYYTGDNIGSRLEKADD